MVFAKLMKQTIHRMAPQKSFPSCPAFSSSYPTCAGHVNDIFSQANEGGYEKYEILRQYFKLEQLKAFAWSNFKGVFGYRIGIRISKSFS